MIPKSILPADQAREMGIKIGDVIIGKLTSPMGCHFTKLKLLFVGQYTTVFQRSNKFSISEIYQDYGFDSEYEHINIDLRHCDWIKEKNEN